MFVYVVTASLPALGPATYPMLVYCEGDKKSAKSIAESCGWVVKKVAQANADDVSGLKDYREVTAWATEECQKRAAQQSAAAAAQREEALAAQKRRAEEQQRREEEQLAKAPRPTPAPSAATTDEFRNIQLLLRTQTDILRAQREHLGVIRGWVTFIGFLFLIFVIYLAVITILRVTQAAA